MSVDYPDFQSLPDDDKSQIVRFLRKAEDEGIEYADENYPPRFVWGGPLDDADGWTIAGRYQDDYDELGYGDEFWRLYELEATDG